MWTNTDRSYSVLCIVLKYGRYLFFQCQLRCIFLAWLRNILSILRRRGINIWEIIRVKCKGSGTKFLRANPIFLFSRNYIYIHIYIYIVTYEAAPSICRPLDECQVIRSDSAVFKPPKLRQANRLTSPTLT